VQIPFPTGVHFLSHTDNSGCLFIINYKGQVLSVLFLIEEDFSVNSRRFSVCFVLFTFSICIQAQESGYRWENVVIGGGGFVSSIVASPVEENLFYARTDVGGAYRWDESRKTWVPLMDWVDITERGLLGVEAIMPDPAGAQKVYMVAGTTYWNYGRTAFLRSSDKGNTWDVIYTWDEQGAKGDAITKFSAHGNGMGRGNGEALAIDPNNSNIMFYGSKNKGLFKSTDNGSTWNHVDAFTAVAGSDTTWNGSGFSFVTFSPGSSTILYAGFLREGDNVFQSTDGGVSWSLIPNCLEPATKGGYVPRLMPQRIAISKDGTALFITFGDGAGPHTMAWDEGWGPIKDWYNRGAVLKYVPATQTWTDISPENFIDPSITKTDDTQNYDPDSVYVACFSGISINPSNPLEIVVSSVGYRGPQFWKLPSGSWKDQWGSNIYYTNDGGENWYPSFQYYWMDGGFYPSTEQMNENGIGWMFNSSIHWSGGVVMDPFNPKRVWVTSGNGVFATDDITAFSYDESAYPPLTQSTVWKVKSHGIEEVVPEEVVSIPGGPLISIIGDYDGFRHDDVRKYPAFRHKTNVNGTMISLGSTRALAWAPKSGKLVKVADARTSNPTGYTDVPIAPIQFSSDSGRTWTVGTYESISADYKKGASVAISTDGEVTLWTPAAKTVNGSDVSGDYPVQRYSNAAWTEVSGIDGAHVMGDPENANVFYAYIKSSGIMYKSTDKGATFSQAGTPGVSNFKKFRLAPNREGDIWIPLTENGLARSIDGGVTFTPVTGVSYCEAVGFGKATQGASYPALFIFGTVASVTGVFQSIDEGKSWTRVNDDAHEYGGLANGEFVVGDMNTFGVVYMSTAGRGIAARLPSGGVSINPVKEIYRKTGVSSARISKNILSLKIPDAKRVSVALYDLRGRTISVKIYNKSSLIPLKSLSHSNGTFVVIVREERNVLLRGRVNQYRDR